MKEIIAKAHTLVEALPYFRAFHGKVFVIKLGGVHLSDAKLKNNVMHDIAAMKYVGIKPVIVHGGGEEVTALSKKMGFKTKFIHGQRVTDKKTVEVASMVLEGKVNGGIVNALNAIGVKAAGLSGRDDSMILVKQASKKLGYVGKIEKVDRELLDVLLDKEIIPVIAPLGVDRGGQVFNINADTVAGEIAVALTAAKLILLTDVPGLLRKPGDAKTLISTVNVRQIASLKKRSVISGGMMPKVDACAMAVKRGVKKAHIMDAHLSHALLLEIFTSEGIGTEIVR